MAINTVKATILMYRGDEEKFNPDELSAGQWAVVLDKKKVYMCFAPGVVLQMSTYEGFDADIKKIYSVLNECKDILDAVKGFEQLAQNHENAAAVSAFNAAAESAKAMAASESSQSNASDAEKSKNESVAAAVGAKLSETNSKGSEDNAKESEEAAAQSASDAADSADVAAQEAVEAADSADDAADSAAAAKESEEAAAESAETAKQYSGKPPKPQNGTWWVWDATDGEYKDTGIKSILSIVRSYPSMAEMMLDAPNMEEGNLVIIASDTEDIDNSKLFVHNGISWVYLSDLSGLQGVGIASVEKTSGTGAPGTVDTYTIKLTDSRTFDFDVYNGQDGSGSGDMSKSVYDTQGRNKDIFDYVDGAMDEKADLVNGKVPSGQLPDMDYIPADEKGVAGGVASLDGTGKVPDSQMPEMDYIPSADKGAPGGVAELDESGKVPDSQLPELNCEPAGSVAEHNESPAAHPLIRQSIAALETVVARKGDSLEYDEEEEELRLKSGEQIISTVKIAGGSGGGGVALPPPTNISLINVDEEVVVKWTDPEDIVVNGATIATWAGTLVVRKIESPPTSRTDGTIVIDSKVRNTYKDVGFLDTGLVNGTEYFYGIFPYTTNKAYTYGATENITPEAIYPSAPAGASVTAGDEEIVVQFEIPEDATGVKIAYSEQQPESNTEPYGTVISNVDSPYAISNALNDTAYYLTVYSINPKGRMTASDMLTITPAAIYPDPPGNVSVKTGDGTITVNFILPENATGAKISYSTQNPESNAVPYGTTITNVESPYVIAGLENDMEYYVTVYSTNAKGRDAAGELLDATPKAAILFGFIINQNESDPDSMITYIEDNENFTPAHMDYENDVFDYGSWADVWFIKELKPCMLGYDGEVKQLLDPNDHAKKLDGTPSDVANADFPGNAMVEIPKVYWKIEDLGNGKGRVYICDVKLDESFVCWSHIDANGDEIDHCYMAMYDGCLINGMLRSLSGYNPLTNISRQQSIDYALANNQSGGFSWSMETYSDRVLINILLILIGKSTNTQAVFGTGDCSSGFEVVKVAGTLNTKGMFWGNQGSTTGVKVFGMEHWWGHVFRNVVGHVNDHGIQKVKMTYGQSDGSAVDGYNISGSGYIEIPDSTMVGGGYISSMVFTQYGLIPKALNGSSTTKYCDVASMANGAITTAMYGGSANQDNASGAFATYMNFGIYETYGNMGSCLSCKPLAQTGG